MIWALLAFHLAAVIALAVAGGRLGRRVFVVAAMPPLATAIWGAGRLATSDPPRVEVAWVSGLDLTFAFEVDPLAALMTMLVSGIGALVFVYAFGYFSEGASGLARFSSTLLAFSASMLGLVWSDSVWTLFVFWELTSITSFLLVGHKNTDASVRRAARRALMITASGGLALLGGLVLLVDEVGSARLGDLTPVSGTGATVAAIAILVAAATKSAQVPFHVWLPGAMAAPTPVSAYLHSATMVKAGVLLVGLAAPAMTEVEIWKPLGLAFGLASMVWGAVGALRHVDAKAILAWGTVSQLGLMTALLALGTGKSTFAAVSIVAAHGLFKAALFMIVGEIDVRTGTRDITELSGLARTMPLACAAAIAAGASMAGVPPLLGFPAKEAAIEAVLGLSGGEKALVASIVVVGSILTVAYTIRLLIGLFGTNGEPTGVRRPRPAMAFPSVLLAAAGVAGYVAAAQVSNAVRPAAIQINPGAAKYELLRWPGLTEAFVVSAIVVALGCGLGWLLRGPRRRVPEPLGAESVDQLIEQTLVGARRLVGRVQHGSLPVYVATMAAVAALATIPFVTAIDTEALRRWDTPMQAALAALVVAAAVGAAMVGSRLGAALGLGAVGIGVTGLFIAHGAPDLALTQLLVETVVVVGFVIGLGHLSRRFPRSGTAWRGVRLLVSAMLAGAVGVALMSSASRPSGVAPVDELTEAAVDEGGGNNIVNVVLTDVRALDTLGEVLVLVVVAVGILALAKPSGSRSNA